MKANVNKIGIRSYCLILILMGITPVLQAQKDSTAHKKLHFFADTQNQDGTGLECEKSQWRSG